MAGGRSSFHVLIPYREPTYEMRRPEGPRTAPFTSEFTVVAPTADDAITEAVRQFRRRALNSSVSWVREIQFDDISVRRLD